MLLSTLTRSPNYKWWAFTAISIGIFTSVVDQISVTVAVPTIADHFNTDLPTVQWVMVGYALTISALLLPMGRLGDVIGRKEVYLVGFVIFVAGAAIAGFSPNMMTMIIAKVIQGVGAAMTQGCSMAMVAAIFPASERGKALGTQMSVVGAGAVAGPALGGLLVATLGWRWVFFINIPAGIIAIAAVLFIVDKARLLQEGQRPSFDRMGATLSAGALVALLLALTLGPKYGWEAAAIIAAIVGFLVLLALFIWWELRVPSPMLDLRLFKRSTFSLGVATGFISFFGTFAIFFLLPFYLQSVRGYDAKWVGLIMVPTAIAMIIMGPLSGRLSDRYGWRILKVVGMLTSAAGLFLLSRLSSDFPIGLVILGTVLQGCGMGLFNSPNSSSIFSAVEQNKYGVVGALISLIRNAASVASIAVGTAIVTAVMASKGYAPSLSAISDAADDAGLFEAFMQGLSITYMVMGGLLLLGTVLSAVQKGRQRQQAPPDLEQAPEPQAGATPSD